MRDGFRRWTAENWAWIAVPAVLVTAALAFLILGGDGAVPGEYSPY